MALSLFIGIIFATSLAVDSERDSSRVTMVEEFTATRHSITPFASVRSYSKSSQCSKDFSSLFNTTDPRGTGFNLGELAFDVSGKPGTGLLSDDTHYALGDYDGCLDIGDMVKYCIAPVSMTYSARHIIELKIAMCVPPSCTKVEHFQEVLDEQNKILVSLQYPLIIEKQEIRCTASHIPYSFGTKAALIVCSLFFLLVIFGSAIDLISKYTSLLGQELDNQNSISSHTNWITWMTSFSILKNTHALMNIQQHPSTIRCINGIRVLSIFMIVLFHTNVTNMFKPIANRAVVEQKIYPRFWYQLILQSYFGVDSFFLLSGTLVAYNTFALMDRRKSGLLSRFPFFRFYIHRYIRLTPNLAFVLLLQYLTVHFTNGPLTIDSSSLINDIDNCDRYWWSNLIYISTLYPSISIHLCQMWTWHFSNDMQFYVIAPLVLIPMYYLFCSGLVVTVVMLAVSFTITGVIAGTYDVSPIYLYQYPPSLQLITDMSAIYTKSYCRIPPFLVGIVLGYLLHNKVHLPFRGTMKYLFVIAMWVVALAIFTSILFGLYPTWHGHVLSAIENIAFYTLTHFAWGVALAIVIFTCHNGYGGIVNRFLSMKL